jgi:hypothetical protein
MKQKSIAQHWLQTKKRRTNVRRNLGCNNPDVIPCPEAVPAPDPEGISLPTFPDSVYEDLPALLEKVVSRSGSEEHRDMMLLASMVTVGCCLPGVYGMHGGKRVYPNLFLFLSAQASAGKGSLVHCRQLVDPIHLALLKESRELKKEYHDRLRQYNMLKWKKGGIEKPEKPPQKMLFIPVNNSASGLLEVLSDNEGIGLLFETEGDSLFVALKANMSYYSDTIRKGFHNEMISLFRRKDHEHIEIRHPRFSGVFSGTPEQILSLIPSAENGLLSRFLFYRMNNPLGWKDMLDTDIDDLEAYFDALGQEFYTFHKALGEQPEIRFCLTEDQHQEFNAFFIRLQDKYLRLYGTDFIATIRRLGLIAFRMAMILTALRMMDSGDFSQKLECRDDDFDRVLSMIGVLVQHSGHVFSQLPTHHQSAKLKDRKEQFLDKLPGTFNRQEFLKLAGELGIQNRVADKYIAIFCEKGLIFREQHNTYTKTIDT